MEKIGFIIDPIKKLHPVKDSSLLLMQAGKKMGFSVFWSSAESVYAENNQVFGLWQEFAAGPAYKKMPLDEFHLIFLREDPPADIDFIQLTYLYELAGTTFINPPAGLRNVSEKIYPLNFPEFIPAQIISRNKDEITGFINQNDIAILKPVGLFGSEAVYKISQTDTGPDKIIAALTQNGQNLIICQKFLPQVAKGDRRIFLVHGNVMGCFDSVPASGDFRGNARFGATFTRAVPTQRELEICEKIKPQLLKDKIYLAGVDFVQELITEINVTCVGGIWNMNHVYGIRYEDQLLKALIDPFL